MIRKNIYQTYRKEYFWEKIRRRTLVYGTVLLAAVTLTGGFAKTDIVYAKSETPEFSWEDYTVTAHALGGIDGITYLNSRESFLESYQKGIRLFEVDLVRTSDDIWVCRHTWKQPMGQWKEEGKKILSSEEFLNTPLEGKYTSVSLEDLFELLQEYPDAFVLPDVKKYSVRDRQMTFDDYTEFVEIARNMEAEDVLDQIIPEIYNQEMFFGASEVYDFQSYLYSFWQEQTEEELAETADFCAENKIPAVTISRDVWTEEIQKIFDDRGLFVCVYTVNDAEEAAGYIRAGASCICSDFLTESDLTELSSNKR